MARPAAAAKPTSAATGARVRRSRSRTANQASRVLLANVDALTANLALRGGTGRLDATSLALRYLGPSHAGGVLAPVPMSGEEATKLAHAQADRIVRVIRSVLKSLDLSEAEYAKGIDLAMKALRAEAAGGWEPL